MPRPLLHDVHKHFTPVAAKNDLFRTKRSRCRHCSEELAFNATKGRKHLNQCHEYRKLFLKRDLQLRLARLIFCGGQPLDLFNSKYWIDLFQTISPAFELPEHDDLVGNLLITVFDECKAEVKRRLGCAEWLNVLLETSEDAHGQTFVKASVQIPNNRPFYWTTINTQDMEVTTKPDYIDYLLSIFSDMAGSNLARVNSIITDNCHVLRDMKQQALQRSDLGHCFWMFRDLDCFQPLIEHISKLPEFTGFFQEAGALFSGFLSSKIQTARLEEEQERLWGKNVTPINSAPICWKNPLVSLKAIEAGRDAFKAYSLRLDVQHDVNEEGVINLRSIIMNTQFWAQLHDLVRILEPVESVKQMLEADCSSISGQVSVWNMIRQKWDVLAKSMTHISWASLLTVLYSQRERQLTTEAYVAWCLDPRTRAQNDSYDPEKVTSFLQLRCGLNKPGDYVRIQMTLMEFRLRQSIFQTFDSSVEQLTKPYNYWIRIRNTNPECILVGPALRLFMCQATTISPRMNSGFHKYISNELESPRSLVADKQAFIYFNSEALDSLEISDSGHGLDTA